MNIKTLTQIERIRLSQFLIDVVEGIDAAMSQFSWSRAAQPTHR